MKNKISILIVAAVFLVFAAGARADVLGETGIFWIAGEYDASQRERISATLKHVSANAYWYAEDALWNALSSARQASYLSAIGGLASEFDGRIYPGLREAFGLEWNPGIDNDSRITVLFHNMKSDAGGYFTPNDEYPKIQIKEDRSNEREMIYVNINHLLNPRVKGFLAHEFHHLITFNQRTKIRGERSDDNTWLNELRSEYAPAYLGYDDVLSGSNLERRKLDFVAEPSDPLAEWRNEKADYANVNVFGQYLVDRFGGGIMTRLIQSSKTGAAVVDEAVSAYDSSLNFSRVFGDWLVSVFLNDCSVGKGQYCYKNQNLKDIKIAPTETFSLSLGGSASVSRVTKDWAGYWYKFNQWPETLKVGVSASAANSRLKVLYITNDFSGKTEAREMDIQKTDNGEQGSVFLSNNPLAFKSVVFVVFNQFKTENFSDNDSSITLLLNAEVVKSEPVASQEPNIAELQKILENLRIQLQDLIRQTQARSASRIARNLSFGTQSGEVRTIQQLLSEAPVGGPEIYPEALITGYFGPATQRAVKRFQCKYNIVCSGSSAATGWGIVGPKTRAKINELLSL